MFKPGRDNLYLLEKAVVREKQIERWGKRREERKLVRKLAFYNFCRIRRSPLSFREHYRARALLS